MPRGSQAPPGSQSRARKGLPASNSTGDTEGQRPHQGAGNSRNVHSPAGPAEPPGTGRWVARTAAPPHQAPLAHRAHSFPLTVMGTEEPALPGAPRTHTAGAPLAVTPAPCPRLQTLTLCPGASVQGQAPPGATAFHPTQGLPGAVFQGAPSWGAACSSLSPSDSLCLQPVGRAQYTIRGTGPRAHVRGGGDMSRGLSAGQLLPTHGHSPPQTR